MKNIDITRKISQGMYVLTTTNGGCIVDAVSQISAGDNPLIAVSVMKKNYTNEMMKSNEKFALSILSNDVNPDIIKTFGFNSMRDINKFEKIDCKEIEGVNVISDSIGYNSTFFLLIRFLCINTSNSNNRILGYKTSFKDNSASSNPYVIF